MLFGCPFMSTLMRQSNHSCWTITCVLALGTFAGAQPQPTDPQTISVCDLFKDLRSHSGEMVSVRGLLYSGREIFAIGGHCDSNFVTEYNTGPVLLGLPTLKSQYVWGTALDLEDSS